MDGAERGPRRKIDSAERRREGYCNRFGDDGRDRAEVGSAAAPRHGRADI